MRPDAYLKGELITAEANKNSNILEVSGTPADCTLISIKVFSPNLIISGPNDTLNIGGLTPYSGTVGAVKTAQLNGIPGVAISVQEHFIPAFVTPILDWVFTN